MVLTPRVRPVYESIANGLTRLKWATPPRNIFVVKKDYDTSVVAATRAFINHVKSAYDVTVSVEDYAEQELGLRGVQRVSPQALRDNIDLIVTLGGDGTILRAASLFREQARPMPPVLSLSLGTLGFLLPFDINDAPLAFDDVYHSRALAMKRHRLQVRSGLAGAATLHAMNDLTIHRGSSPHLTYIDITVNNDPVTTAIGDGLTVSTPTGSTAYSLSAGGSIVHPAVSCVLMTPICPRSLSFRPLIFPADANISIAMGQQARGPSELSLDGVSMGQLTRGDAVNVRLSADDSVWCVTRRQDDWVQNLNALLGFNQKFGKPADNE